MDKGSNCGKKRSLAEINVVPYIDVMLVLLVIFMITTPLLSQGVKVDLPKAAAKPLSAAQKEPIIVSVDAAGNYYLNIATSPEKPVTAESLSAQVAVELKSRANIGANQQVLVKGDKNVNYGRVVKAMVLLQQAGANSVGLITKSDNSSV